MKLHDACSKILSLAQYVKTLRSSKLQLTLPSVYRGATNFLQRQKIEKNSGCSKPTFVMIIRFNSFTTQSPLLTAWKTLWEKEKMLVTSIFSFLNDVLYPMKGIFHVFSKIKFVVCKCFQFGQVQNFVVWVKS